MMETPKKYLIVVVTLLAFCELIETKGLCQFAEMFPSKGAESCFGRAKNAKEEEGQKKSTTRYETREPIATKKQTTQPLLISERPTYQPNNKISTTDRSPTFQPSTQLTIDQQNYKHSTPKTLKTVKLTDVTTKKLTSVPTTSISKNDNDTPTAHLAATFQLSTKLTHQPNHEQSISELPTTVQMTQVTTELLTTIPPTSPPCAFNMVLGPSCDCAKTCQNPTNCSCTGPETCVCPDGFLLNNTECVPAQNCGCYYNESLVILDGYTYVNDDCSKSCTCSNNQLRCNSGYTCSPYATCGVRDGVAQCFCNDGYIGDGEVCILYTDCYDAYQAGHRQDGFFTILPYGWPGSSFTVWCDMTNSGGGWTIIQRRLYTGQFGSSKKWQEYSDGFSYGPTADNHWLGNHKMFYLTHQRNYKFRVDLVSSDNSTTYQEYSLFKIANESDNYRLIELGSSSGTAGDGMDGSLGRPFSTVDRDNDECDDITCSVEHGNRGWWYSNTWCDECCTTNYQTCFLQSSNCKKRCTKANLNGDFDNFDTASLTKLAFWNDILFIKSTEIKIRPTN